MYFSFNFWREYHFYNCINFSLWLNLSKLQNVHANIKKLTKYFFTIKFNYILSTYNNDACKA